MTSSGSAGGYAEGPEHDGHSGEGGNVVADMGSGEERVVVEEPRVGMCFENMEELYDFYTKYGKGKGFGISKRGARKDCLTGEHRWMTITCNKGREHRSKGKNILSRRPSGRVGCKARLSCVKEGDIWVISKVNLVHNHEVRPDQSRYIRQHRKVDAHCQRQLEVNDKAGLRPCQNVKAVIYKAGGHGELPCLGVDLTNHVSKVRRLQVIGGDAQALHELFGKMQTDSRDFVYVIKPDKEGRLKHVFWADGRCRAAYKEFSDVVTFDTTYLVNKYDMPLASFVGVNHHGQSILLGCALVNNEKCKTFTWLFETWLTCMDGIHPEAIITDQCAQIGEAIKKVFPKTRHRWCLWHILTKLPMKIGGSNDYEKIKDAFMAVVYDTNSKEEFEEQWIVMVEEFQLQNNEWLQSLYANRQYWALVYVKPSFWAGMSSTQRSESMHSFFDGYVHSRTTLTQFAEQYELAVRQKVEKEMQEDFLSGNSLIPCVTVLSLEKQMRDAYTNSMFRHVQKNLTDIMYCDASLSYCCGRKVVYEVTQIVSRGGSSSKRVGFIVSFDRENVEANCNCNLFSFKGILCPHVFKVFTYNDVSLIPERYILRRWRKDIGRVHTSIKIGRISMSPEMRRAEDLEKVFYSTLAKAVEDKEKYEYLMGRLIEESEVMEKWAARPGSCEGESKGKKKSINGVGVKAVEDTGPSTRQYKDPVIVKRRGRPKMNRMLAGNEQKHRVKKNQRKRKAYRNVAAAGFSGQHSTSATALLNQAHEGTLLQSRVSSSAMAMCVGENNQMGEFVWPAVEGMHSPPSVNIWVPNGNAVFGSCAPTIGMQVGWKGIA